MTTQSPLLGFSNATEEQAREIGANAARVIKKLPLRMGEGY